MRFQLRRTAFVLLAFLLFFCVDFFAYPYGQPPAGHTVNQSENGLWLHFSWYAGAHSASDAQRLAQRLTDTQTRFAYFHVRGMTEAGTLRFHNPQEAQRLIKKLHRAVPTVKLMAWIYAGNKDGAGRVDLSHPAVRAEMVQEAAWLVNTCGFDGVQWDYEICPDGDAGFLALLRETRAALGKDRLLSVATPLWLPHTIGPYGWSDGYFAQVATLCDQMCVMAYDAACPSPRAYAWLVSMQVVHVTQDAVQGNPRCRVLVGVPTYAHGGLSHDPRIENIGMALRGVRQGTNDPQARLSTFAGVAVFADYTTQPDEWQTYRNLWLR